jgi:toxin ParE1/3/4
MKSLVFSPKAEADINHIYDYTEERWGYEKAEAYTFELRDACQMLAQGHRHGKSVDGVARKYLMLRHNAHFIIYRQAGHRITVIRILHQRMNVRRHL